MTAHIDPDKVAVYIRWSTEDQGQGHTLAIQRESCGYYCLSQGWRPRDELTYIDDGYSGGNLERPALTRLRRAVKDGLVDCVIVYKLDRLSRNVKDIINLVLDEWEDGCCVRSTLEPVDTTSDAGKLFFTMLGSFADFERSTIKTRTWSGKRKNAEHGKNPGMSYPYGLSKAEDGGWAIVPHEAAAVQRIYSEYIMGKSCRLIAFSLNSEGMRTRRGGFWAGADISRLLRNPIYAGRLVYNRQAFALRRKLGRLTAKEPADVITRDGAVPAIVPPETWALAERIRLARPRVDRGAVSPRTLASPYLLAGLLRCPCGHAWVGIQGGKHGERFYACGGARSAGPARCASRAIKAETLDALVFEVARNACTVRPAVAPGAVAGPDPAGAGVRLSALRHRLGAVTRSLERFKQDYAGGKLSAEVYMELSAEAHRERDELHRLLTQATPAQPNPLTPDRIASLLQQLDPWEALDLRARQQILRHLIERIVLMRPKDGGEIDLSIEWRVPAPELSVI